MEFMLKVYLPNLETFFDDGNSKLVGANGYYGSGSSSLDDGISISPTDLFISCDVSSFFELYYSLSIVDKFFCVLTISFAKGLFLLNSYLFVFLKLVYLELIFSWFNNCLFILGFKALEVFLWPRSIWLSGSVSAESEYTSLFLLFLIRLSFDAVL